MKSEMITKTMMQKENLKKIIGNEVYCTPLLFG